LSQHLQKPSKQLLQHCLGYKMTRQELPHQEDHENVTLQLDVPVNDSQGYHNQVKGVVS